MRRLFIVCLIGFAINGAWAQSSDMKLYSMMYPTESAVILKNDENTTVTFDKDKKLNISKEVYEETFILSSGTSYSERSVGYSDFNELVDLTAKTMVPVRNSYKEVNAEKIETRKDLDDEIFYDDYMNKMVYFAGVQPGAKTVLSYKINVKKPQLMTPFFFESYAPCLESSYSITVPKNVNIGYKLFNADDKSVTFTKTEKGGEVTYTWKGSYVNKFHFEDDAPNLRYYIPHLVVYITDYTIDGVKSDVLANKDDLYKWYYPYVSNLNKTISPALTRITDSLVANQPTELAKVKSIYYWVINNIKYVAFEDGMQGYIPRQADSICMKRYGDCKDMASIITAMLSVAKIPSYLTWIGTRDIPYSYDDVPLPMADNHMIATYMDNGNPVFLDGTSDYNTFGYPSSFIQDKEALLAIDKDNYKIIKVPIVPKEANATRDSIVLNINDQNLEGTGSESVKGYIRQNLAYRLNHTKGADIKKVMQAYLETGNNKFKLDTVAIQNMRDNDKDIIIDYKFLLQNYMVRTSDEIFVNLNLDKSYFNDLIDIDKRKLDKESNFKYSETHTSVLNFPAGYSLESKPENSSYSNDLFGYTITYTQNGSQLIQQKTIYINYLVLKTDKFQQWNEMIKSLNKAYNEAVILKKNS